MKFVIPGMKEFEILTIVLDLNGTLTIGGELVHGVKEKIAELKQLGYRLIIFSGDTRGNGSRIAKYLDIEFINAGTAVQKETEVKKIQPETCATIGNGLIDIKKIQAVRLGIVTLQAEGVHTKTLLAADIIVPSIIDALDLFIDTDRLIATMRS